MGNCLGNPAEGSLSERHYIDCGGTILACYDPRVDGDDFDARPNQEHIYFSLPDLEAFFGRAKSCWLQLS